MIIRAAGPDDFDQVAAITNHYIRTTAIHFAYEPVAPEAMRSAWMASRERYAFLIAQEPGTHALAGYAKAAPWRERTAYDWAAEVGVYVRPDMHRRGVGRSLYVALIDICRRQGFHTLIAGVALPNDASVRLHEGVGFERVGTFRRVGWKFGAWHDVGFWEMPLRDAHHSAGAIAPPAPPGPAAPPA